MASNDVGVLGLSWNGAIGMGAAVAGTEAALLFAHMLDQRGSYVSRLSKRRATDGLIASAVAIARESPWVFFLGAASVAALAMAGLSLHPAALAALLIAWVSSFVAFHGSRTGNHTIRVAGGVARPAFGALGMAAVHYSGCGSENWAP